MNGPTKTLLWLWALSLTTTLLARFAPGGSPWVSLAFLGLAGWKARHILNGYLGLGPSRVWRRAFNALVTVFLMLAAGIYLLPDML
ncbi:MAG TPA: hypothetical protein ENK41_00275 [Rhodobacteraceae bacterium]|nr:hypothetical protein [Paracoccaceae bacterium]